MKTTLRIITALLATLCLGVQAEEKKPALEGPKLSAEQKVKLLEAKIAAVESREKLSGYMATIQAQLEKMPEYAQLRAAAQSNSAAFSKAISDVMTETKCADCTFDPDKMTLAKPDPKQAKIINGPLPVAATVPAKQ